MFESKDLLFIVLAFCVLWSTAFFCWFLFQVAMVIKNINSLLQEVKAQFERFDQTLNSMKDKFHEGSGYLGSLTDQAREYMNARLGKK